MYARKPLQTRDTSPEMMCGVNSSRRLPTGVKRIWHFSTGPFWVGDLLCPGRASDSTFPYCREAAKPIVNLLPLLSSLAHPVCCLRGLNRHSASPVEYNGVLRGMGKYSRLSFANTSKTSHARFTCNILARVCYRSLCIDLAYVSALSESRSGRYLDRIPETAPLDDRSFTSQADSTTPTLLKMIRTGCD
jgi:hypothetical protein